MSGSFSRRNFFNRFNGRPAALRPPGALPEMDFDAACTRCGDCLPACPEQILSAGLAGLPEISFADGGCTFCGACAAACKAGAIQAVAGWSLKAAVSDACLESQGVTCRVCESSCEEFALRFRPMTGGRSKVVVLEDRCSGCGACVSTCPVAAITISEALEATAQSEERECHRA